jgi:hypothetical protein
MKELLTEWEDWVGKGTEEIKEHNLEMLDSFEDLFEDELRFSLTEAIEEGSFPPLVNHKLIGFLGSGQLGSVFKLENDHALKIFYHEWGDGGEEFSTRIDSRKFDELINSNDLVVYDSGQVKSGALTGAKWREIPVIIPLLTWIKTTRPKQNLSWFEKLFSISIHRPYKGLSKHRLRQQRDSNTKLGNKVLEALESRSLTVDSYIRILKATVYRDRSPIDFQEVIEKPIRLLHSALGSQDFLGLIKAYNALLRDDIMIDDAHIGNIGIVPTSHQFVIFDN